MTNPDTSLLNRASQKAAQAAATLIRRHRRGEIDGLTAKDPDLVFKSTLINELVKSIEPPASLSDAELAGWKACKKAILHQAKYKGKHHDQ